MHENRETSETPAVNQAGRRRRLKPHGPHVRLRGVGLRHSTDEPFEQRRNLSAESEEGRPRIKENTVQSDTYPTQSGERVSQGLSGVRRAIRLAATHPR